MSILTDSLSQNFSITVFYDYSKKLTRDWGKFSSISIVLDTFYVKYGSVLARQFS